VSTSLEDVTLSDLFERRVVEDPSRIAIAPHNISYAALNTWSNQIAHLLLAAGVRRQSIVGVNLGRCPEMVASLLAIIKVGATYLPLDPDYPPRRLAFMIDETDLSFIITKRRLPRILGNRNVHIEYLDVDADVMIAYAKTNLGIRANADDLAYIFYTSGSTGQPKGVEISHSSIVRYAQAIITSYDLRLLGGRIHIVRSVNPRIANSANFRLLFGAYWASSCGCAGSVFWCYCELLGYKNLEHYAELAAPDD
jgi:non-ribosomal peptide synthetase component F